MTWLFTIGKLFLCRRAKREKQNFLGNNPTGKRFSFCFFSRFVFLLRLSERFWLIELLTNESNHISYSWLVECIPVTLSLRSRMRTRERERALKNGKIISEKTFFFVKKPSMSFKTNVSCLYRLKWFLSSSINSAFSRQSKLQQTHWKHCKAERRLSSRRDKSFT